MLKRQLWDGLLREAYGTPVGDDALFLQHTYLTIVAKTIAARVLDLPADDAGSILSGRALDEVGIQGAVESDFFDWILELADGRDLVVRIARQTARFRLRDVQADVLKSLYESLIDPAQRHDLGEYYTPDWLAAKVTARALTDPLAQRVLDPACGSGTFLFHAIRRKLAAAEAAGWTRAAAVAACVQQVRGLDVHPVAVIIARVTWLLALGRRSRSARANCTSRSISATQCNGICAQVGDTRDVVVQVPDDAPLHVPAGFAEDQARFDHGLQTLAQGLHEGASSAQVERALLRIEGVAAQDASAMSETFERLRELYETGRNGIWPFVLRNLMRPLWLSRPEQRADVLLGNPPWIAYRHLSAEMKPRLRAACRQMNFWVGGVLATQQDMSALFWARGAERYLRPGGTIAFVLPYAAINRPGFRAGCAVATSTMSNCAWSRLGIWRGSVRYSAAQLIGTTSTCVLFGRREPAGALPAQVEQFSRGSCRDATPAKQRRIVARRAARALAAHDTLGRVAIPGTLQAGCHDRAAPLLFGRAGARRGGSGRIPLAPRVRGKDGASRQGAVDGMSSRLAGRSRPEFLRPLLLGENIAPFRLLETALAVIPARGRGILRRPGGSRLLDTAILPPGCATSKPNGGRIPTSGRMAHLE